MLETDQVAVAFFGDGAVNNGAFHEGLNMASIWKLPVLFVCENNQFATEVPFAYAAGNPSVASRAPATACPGSTLTATTSSLSTRQPPQAVERARKRRRADAARVPDLSHAAARRRHGRLLVPHPRRGRGLESALPDPPISRTCDRSTRLSGTSAEARGHRGRDRQPSSTTHSQFAEISPGPTPRPATRFVFDESRPGHRAARRHGPAKPAARARSASCRPRSRALARRWRATRRSSCWVKGSAYAAATSRRPPGLYERYGPVRLCDTPICERGFVGLGCGAAMTGTRPVIDFMFADFVLDAVGEIINQIAKIQYMSSGRLKMPIVLRGCIGIGHSAATHHSGNYYPMFAQFPGLRVVVPSTPHDAQGLLNQALRCDDPVLFLEHREILGIKGPVPDGRLRDRVRPGGDRSRGDATSRSSRWP